MRAVVPLLVLVATSLAPIAAQAEEAVAAPQAAQAADAAPAPAPMAAVLPAASEPAAPAPKKLAIDLGGYAKVGFTYQQADPANPLIGHTNGFRMAAARLELGAQPMENARVALSIEGAFDRIGAGLGFEGEKQVALRDAYFAYQFFPWLVATAGQFKAPFAAETLLPDGGLTFFDRSIVSRGVAAPEGNAAEGLSLERQLGVSVSSKRLAMGDFGFTYAAGVFNGNGANVLLNDDRSLTPVARVSFDWSEKVALGFAGHFNPFSTGTLPDVDEVRDLGLTADLCVHLSNLRFLASLVGRARQYVTTGADTETSAGLMAQISYWLPGTGLEPALRVATLDPSNLLEGDAVMHATAGLNWRPENKPWRLYGAFVLRAEEKQQTLENNGVELGGQLSF